MSPEASRSVPEQGPPALHPRLDRAEGSVCFQCNRCTAGCPMVSVMDLTPAQIVHQLLLGERDLVLASEAIWACVHCETCTTRCPQGVPVAEILEAARAEAWRLGKVSPDQPVAAYFASFLENLLLFGRAAELLLTLMCKAKSEEYLRDLPLGGRLFARGRLNPLERPRGAATLRRLYQRAREREAPPA